MRHTTWLRLSIAAVLTAIATTAMADAIDSYKDKVSAAIQSWLSDTNQDDTALTSMFNDLENVAKDPNKSLADVKQKQDEITNYKSGTVEGLHGGFITNEVGRQIASPLADDKSLANQKGTGERLANWIKEEIQRQANGKGWSQIRTVEAEVTWSDDSFNNNNRPAIRLTFKYSKDEHAVQSLKMR